jgi:hypothetical protein
MLSEGENVISFLEGSTPLLSILVLNDVDLARRFVDVDCVQTLVFRSADGVTPESEG